MVYILGWVDFDEKIILNKSTPGIYSFLCNSSENMLEKINFEVTIGLREGLLGRYLIRAENKIVRTQSCHISKDAELYVYFKNINLPW
jgi:hypothetical protein